MSELQRTNPTIKETWEVSEDEELPYKFRDILDTFLRVGPPKCWGDIPYTPRFFNEHGEEVFTRCAEQGNPKTLGLCAKHYEEIVG